MPADAGSHGGRGAYAVGKHATRRSGDLDPGYRGRLKEHRMSKPFKGTISRYASVGPANGDASPACATRMSSRSLAAVITARVPADPASSDG